MAKVPMSYLLSSVIVVILTLEFDQVHGECNLRNLNVTLNNTCDFSDWLQWNCTCCGNDVISKHFAIRKRAVCCNKGEVSLINCLQGCGYNTTADTEYGECGTYCKNKTSASINCKMNSITTTITTPAQSSLELVSTSKTRQLTTVSIWLSTLTSNIPSFKREPTSELTSQSTLMTSSSTGQSRSIVDATYSSSYNNVTGSAHGSGRHIDGSALAGGLAGGVAFVLLLLIFVLVIRAKKSHGRTVHPG